MALIEVKDLYKIYNPGENEVRALDGVSLTIDRGEFVAIIGHSGSGKSTFMNMLGLLDVPTSGEYKLDGHNTSKLSDDEMSEIRNKEIGFIFQGFNLISSLTAQENVELPLIYQGIDPIDHFVVALVFTCYACYRPLTILRNIPRYRIEAIGIGVTKFIYLKRDISIRIGILFGIGKPHCTIDIQQFQTLQFVIFHFEFIAECNTCH